MPVMKQGLLPEMVKTFTGHNTIKVSPLSFPNPRILRHPERLIDRHPATNKNAPQDCEAFGAENETRT